jgi:cytochrome c-type biogenesis protein CcsB
MRTMVILILLFAIAIGTATFIENDFGTPASKAVVYNTSWFELLLFLLFINLVANIQRYKLMQWKKWPVFLFHFAFILILLGSAVTRYISYEGILHIREGKSSSLMQSDKTYLQIKVDDKVQQYTYDKQMFVNPLYNKPFDHSFDFSGKKVDIIVLNAYADAGYYMEELDEGGVSMLELVTTDGNGRITRYVQDGENIFLGRLPLTFNADEAFETAFKVNETDSGIVFISPFPVSYLSMDNQSTGILGADTVQYFKPRHLYSIGNVKLVLKKYSPHAKLAVNEEVENSSLSILELAVNVGDEQKNVFVEGGKGFVTSPTTFTLGDLNFTLGFGAKYIQLPFSIALVDFELDRYPGSMSPASYASEVILEDPANNLREEHRIYMNHVLDYKGFRFFQSSYDKDELGTVLSVNHDRLGTVITYLGYLLMAIGMFFTLFVKGTRYDRLKETLSKLKEKSMIILAILALGTQVYAQDSHDHSHDIGAMKEHALAIDKEHAKAFGELLIQDKGGRVKPLNTMASEVIRKVTRQEEFDGLDPSQLYLSMLVYPEYWQTVPMIKVTHDGVKEKLDVDGKYATFLNLFNDNFQYVLGPELEEINRKKESERSKYEKDILAVDERVNICYMLYTGSMLRIFPDSGDVNDTWYASVADPFPFRGEDSLFVKSILGMYFGTVAEATQTGDWSSADQMLSYIVQYQHKFGKDILPSESKVKLEIWYNKAQIFKKLFEFYGLISFILLIVLFIDVFRDKKGKGWLVKGLKGLLIFGFAFHMIGLIIRWYISGHAPWSNAYESMIFIAWATMLAGIIFSRRSTIAIAVTGILASLILMVAHLNWMDPEITNLVPVLNSYWLMIHVAIITSSYGFLGLSSLLGFLNLIMMIFKGDNNKKRINTTIKELTTINEMTVQVGLFLLTIGTFLGGVWANESWGRYWGWDAKETWALVTVLIYAFVAHMRFVPGLKSQYAYNVATLVAYLSVLMTYFGVNYYLSGLHSYAAGDPFPIPTFVPITLFIMFLIIVIARIRIRKTETRAINE